MRRLLMWAGMYLICSSLVPSRAAAATAAGLLVSGPAIAPAGAAITLNVAAVDATGAAVAGYTGSVHFASTDGAGVVPADYAFSGAGTGHDNGVHSFSLTLQTTGFQSVTVTDAASGLTGTATVKVGGDLPAPASSGINHIIVVMMENRSFDHLLGWLPGADGELHRRFVDSRGAVHRTHELAPDFQGCGFLDPGHAYSDGRVQYHNGAADGWLLDGSDSDAAANANQANDTYAIGFYRQADLPFLGNAVPAWTTSDRYFAGILAETFPNRFHQHAAQTDRLHNVTTFGSALPTIWDRLAAAGLNGTYYFNNLAFLALWGPKYTSISKPFSQFLTAAASGTLPDVAFIDPFFNVSDQGTETDDHPHSDIRNGEAFLNTIYDAVRNSPQWAHTLLIVNFDEWGGFWDHVPPPVAPIPPATKAAGDNDGRLGFRVPLLVISPYARRGYVSHEQFDHTSVLRLIEWRFGLAPLTARDATANNLADVLDFSHADLSSPAFSVPAGPFGHACAATTSTTSSTGPAAERQKAWKVLRGLSLANGFPVAE